MPRQAAGGHAAPSTKLAGMTGGVADLLTRTELMQSAVLVDI
jgi:hypothetical protein